MNNSEVQKFPQRWVVLVKDFDFYLLLVVLISSFIPIIGTQLYFRHDDAQLVLWGREYIGNFIEIFSPKNSLWMFSSYLGLSAYYRPFLFLYFVIMARVFGANPFYYQLIAGLMMIGSVIFMYKIVEILANRNAAFLSVIAFYLCFNSILYQSFRVGVPFGYFFELGCFYFCLLGLKKNRILYLIISFLLLLPASSRQTSMIIFPAIIMTYFISNWKESLPNIKAKIVILGIAMIVPCIIIPFSRAAVGTAFSTSSTIGELFKHISERLYFYGGILTKGVTGIIIFFSIIFFGGHQLISLAKNSVLKYRIYLLLLIASDIVLTLFLTQLKQISIILLLLVLGLSFLLNKRIRCPVIWFFVSLGCFTVIQFYLGAYLIEAAYGLSIAIGILLFYFLMKTNEAFGVKQFIKRNAKFLVCISAVVFIVMGLTFLKIGRIPLVSKKLQDIEILINTNRNFNDLMCYLHDELPQNAVVYGFSYEDLGINKEKTRFWSLRDRAEIIKVMEVRESEAMIRALGRYDIKIKEMSGMPKESIGIGNRYFIVCNRLEKQFIEKNYSLQLLKEIKRDETIAAVYLLKGRK